MSKKTVLITGCSEGGIGAALAKAFHAKGYHVYATLRNPTKAGSLEGVQGIEISTLDVTRKESIEQCLQYIKTKTGGKLDVLVNNAGADCTMPLLDVSLEEAKALYDLNVWAVLALTQAFVPMLIKARGTVVNINSVGAQMILAWGGIYFSSKAAANSISETLRIELKPLGVRVVTAMVGAVTTPIHDNSGDLKLPENSYYQKARGEIWDQRRGMKKPRSQNADKVAKNIVHDVVRGKSGQIWRGGLATVCGFLPFLPKRIVEFATHVVVVNRGLSKVRLDT
ncbi:hypothetical protein N0V82_002563 [Gnomoniopsis sp. IMI 355080]|nr:hypothetical protein N0V82_002563 [Gnomoniopsis sp. IMI 355080]